MNALAQEPEEGEREERGRITNAPQAGTGPFLTISYASTILAVLCLVLPELLLSNIIGDTSPTSVEVAHLRLFGGTLLIQAAVKRSLRGAAWQGALNEPHNQWLMTGVMAQSAVYMLAFLMTSDTVKTPTFVSMYLLLTLVPLAVTAIAYTQSNNGSFALPRIPSMSALAPKTLTSGFYAVMAAGYLAIAGAALFGPQVIFEGKMTDVALMARYSLAPGCFLSALTCLILKGAEDRNELGMWPFRFLNLGLAGTEAVTASVYIMMLLTDEVVSVPVAVGAGLFSTVQTVFPLYQYLAAKHVVPEVPTIVLDDRDKRKRS
jgi:hypothetical protein